MEDIMANLVYSVDFARMDGNTRTLLVDVYKSLPHPAVSTKARLSSAAAARPPADGVDRISRLPAEILCDIVSRLPVKDAARTTVLSTRWRRVWHTAPLALVDAHLFPATADDGFFGHLVALAKSGQRGVAAAVSRVLAAHPGPFRSVYLVSTPMDTRPAEIFRWLDLLAAKGVKDLFFVNRLRKFGADLEIPDTIFRCTSVTRLYLGCWRLPSTAGLPRGTAFPYLRELGLTGTIMGERDLAFLLDRCPVLEKLLIAGNLWPVRVRVKSSSLRCVEVCTGFVPEITVVQASRLERLLLWDALGLGQGSSLTNLSATVKIGHAPMLRILGFLVPGMHQLEIGNTIIKGGTQPSHNTTVPSVRMLGMVVRLGSRGETRMLPSFLRCFPNIETLYVQSENPEFKFGGPQCNVTCKLDVKSWDRSGSIECVQRHIKKVVFREFRGQQSELDFLKFIAERGQVLQEMVVFMSYGYSPSDGAGGKLRTFMASAKWANRCCKLKILKCPFPGEGTAWCFLRPFNFSIQDPFDMSECYQENHSCQECQ